MQKSTKLAKNRRKSNLKMATREMVYGVPTKSVSIEHILKSKNILDKYLSTIQARKLEK